MAKVNPYSRLLQSAKEWARKVKYEHRKTMWQYPKAELSRNGGWRLDDLWQRVQAANQLGYRVEVIADDNGVTMQYVKNHEEAPWEFRP